MRLNLNNKTLRKLMPAAVAAVVVCATAPMLRTQVLSAADIYLSSADAKLAADRLTVTAAGAYYNDGTGRVTGKFGLAPTFTLGDLNGDDAVTASDAAVILAASSMGGLGQDGDALWQEVTGEDLAVASIAEMHADVNEDGKVTSSDAALVLSYAASSGMGDTVNPLGYAYFYADENGYLMTGAITDAATGKMYYAGEDYKLCTGWVTDETGTYLLDENGVMVHDCWVSAEDGQKVYLGENGAVVTEGWVEDEENRYYLGADGQPVTGQVTLSDGTYRFRDNGTVITGWFVDGGATYHAEETGRLSHSFTTIDGVTYYFFNDNFRMATNWVKMTQGQLYFGTDGVMRKSQWECISGKYYYFNENGVRQSGLLELEDGTYYMDEDGVRQTGLVIVDGVYRYFDETTGRASAGTYTDAQGTHRFDENGNPVTGWYYDEETWEEYWFDENGLMATGMRTIDGVTYNFNSSGVCLGQVTYSGNDVNTMINTAALGARKTKITVYNRQTNPTSVDFTLTLKDSDVANIEKFLAEHTNDSMTLAEKLYTVHQWIHYEVDYAYAGEKWNEIVNLTYTDAIFNHKKGQCVQYNGAMALTLAYFGFDVYMVRGWTSPGTQHYWTEVNLNGHTYMVECGNSGKNGDWWQEFFELIE